jgi:hypothetical protein
VPVREVQGAQTKAGSLMGTKQQVERATKFRDAAVADGWSIEPTYEGSEDVSRAAKLRRDGFVMSVLTRTPTDKPYQNYYEGSVSIWAPDGMSVKTPNEYSYEAIVAGVRTCNECGATDVETHRFSFAGRCCAKCLPAARRVAEPPGWAD